MVISEVFLHVNYILFTVHYCKSVPYVNVVFHSYTDVTIVDVTQQDDRSWPLFLNISEREKHKKISCLQNESHKNL